jgi:hypothetical protein
MKYVTIVNINPSQAERLRESIPAEAFLHLEEAIHSGRTPSEEELLSKGVEKEFAELLVAHLSYLKSLNDRGILESGGPCKGFNKAVNIFEADSEEKAREFQEGDPFFKYGMLSDYEILEWNKVF